MNIEGSDCLANGSPNNAANGFVIATVWIFWFPNFWMIWRNILTVLKMFKLWNNRLHWTNEMDYKCSGYLAFNCISRFEEFFEIRLIVIKVMRSEWKPKVEVIAGKTVTAFHCTSMVRWLFWHYLIFDTNSGVLLLSKACQVKEIRKSKTLIERQWLPSLDISCAVRCFLLDIYSLTPISGAADWRHKTNDSNLFGFNNKKPFSIPRKVW
jgi:hypothetical protein